MTEQTKCLICNRWIDPRFVDNGTCHFCKKMTKWTALPSNYNVPVQLSLVTGHWKAYYLVQQSIIPTYLLASGQLPFNALNTANVEKMITNQILNAVKQQYKPDPKFDFTGDVRMFYLQLEPTILRIADVLEIVRKNSVNTLLPSLVMKTHEWHMFYPQINKANPYQLGNVRLVKATIHGTADETDMVSILPESIMPYRPTVVRIDGIYNQRFAVTIDCDGKLYTMDIINKIGNR